MLLNPASTVLPRCGSGASAWPGTNQLRPKKDHANLSGFRSTMSIQRPIRPGGSNSRCTSTILQVQRLCLLVHTGASYVHSSTAGSRPLPDMMWGPESQHHKHDYLACPTDRSINSSGTLHATLHPSSLALLCIMSILAIMQLQPPTEHCKVTNVALWCPQSTAATSRCHCV